jgi:hypothetical protein
METYGDATERSDEFYAPPPPDGWEYQWKRVSVAGKEDGHYLTSLLHTGWRAVDVSRHPEMMPAGYSGAIERKGLRLMEKPEVLVQRARRREQQEALDVKANADAALYDAPVGTAERSDHRGNSILQMGVTKDIMRPVGGR